MAESAEFKKEREGGSEFIDKLVAINRVTKVVKGGRRFGFASLVIVGDGKGKVGYGSGKAKEVMESKQKATQDAKKNMVRIPLREGRTIHHDVRGHFGSGKVVLRAALQVLVLLLVAQCVLFSKLLASKMLLQNLLVRLIHITW